MGKEKIKPMTTRLWKLLQEHPDITVEFLQNRYMTSPYHIKDWFNGQRLPAYTTLLDLVSMLNVNIEYALSLTDVNWPDESYTVSNRMKEIRESCGISLNHLANLSGITWPTAKAFEEDQAAYQVDTIYNLAKSLEVSMDYMMGLTSWPKWDDIWFFEIPPGHAAFLTINDTETYCLRSTDGKQLLLPNGQSYTMENMWKLGNVHVELLSKAKSLLK